MLYLAAVFFPVVALAWTRHVWWTVAYLVGAATAILIFGLIPLIAAWIYSFVAVYHYYQEQRAEQYRETVRTMIGEPVD